MKLKLFFIYALCLVPCALLSACSKPDPILPGVRTPVFDAPTTAKRLGAIPENVLSDGFARIKVSQPQTDYQQNLNNEVFQILPDGEKRKIFAGFPTNGKVSVPRAPVFYKNFVYAGLTTGELVKINPKNRQVVWIADIFKDLDMLGGGSVLDIVAPVVIDEDRLFAGGMGRAFCQINIESGDKKWCADIAVAAPFLIAGDLAFAVGADENLYALNARSGAVYWVAPIDDVSVPHMESKDGKFILDVDGQQFDAATGTPE